jgi:hypothetical protein
VLAASRLGRDDRTESNAMSKVVKITLHRTPEWVCNRRIETGENVPERIEVAVPVDQLPREVRKLLLEAGSGSYPDEFAGDYRQDFRWMYRSDYHHGRVPIVLDDDRPTPEAVAEAILAADAERQRRKAKADEEARQRAKREQALAEEWARLPLQQRASAAGVCVARDPQTGAMSACGVHVYDIEVLRRYAPEALAEAMREVERLREIERGREAIKHRALLAELLLCVPDDALRHALKEAATDGFGDKPAPIEDVRQQVQKACEAAGVELTL